MSSWNSKIPLPDSLLHALHQHHPDAHLCASSKQLHQAALSSPQLRQLAISIPCSDFIRPASAAPFGQLKQIILQNQNIRALTLDIHQDFNLRQIADAEARQNGDLPYLTWEVIPVVDMFESMRKSNLKLGIDALTSIRTLNKIQIPLASGDRLPPLEELDIRAVTYDFDREHCQQLRRSMDWTNLERLRIGPCDTENFFEVFTGEIPHLQHLDFSFHSLNSGSFTYLMNTMNSVARLYACAEFIGSVKALKVLIVRGAWFDFSTHFWQCLANTHAKHLEHLSLQPRFTGHEPPRYKPSLRDYLLSFTSLRTLELALPIIDGTYSRCTSSCGHALVGGKILSLDLI